jgi:hypothetical protein
MSGEERLNLGKPRNWNCEIDPLTYLHRLNPLQKNTLLHICNVSVQESGFQTSREVGTAGQATFAPGRDCRLSYLKIHRDN